MKQYLKFFGLLFVILLTINSTFSATKNTNKINYSYDDQYYYTQAAEYLRNGNVLQAQDYLTRTLKINPKNHEAHFMQGNIDLHYGRYQSAVKNYNLAIKYSKDKSYNYYMQRSLCLIQLGKYKEALQDLIIMRKMANGGPLNTQNTLIYLNCGIVEAKSAGQDIELPIKKITTKDGFIDISYSTDYNIQTLTKKEYEIINKHLTEGIKDYPNNPIFYTIRGVCALKYNKKDLALADFNKAIEINPVFYPAIVERANTYFLNSQFSLSLRDYQMLNTVIPKNNYILWKIGENYLELGDYNKARSYFNLSLQKAKNKKYTDKDIELYMESIKRMIEHQTKDREYSDIISKLNEIIREYNNTKKSN